MLRKAASIGVLGALATLMLASLAAAQSQQAPAAPARGNQAGTAPAGGGGFMPGNFDPTQIQQMMDDNNRQSLNATPDEWKVLGPKFSKVQTLVRSINGGVTGMFGMFGMGRGGMGMPGGPGGMGNPMMGGLASIFGEPTDLDKARDGLYAALDNTSATPAELQKTLTTYRQAREKARTELTSAQADLKKVLTVKQEVTLVAMGLLD